MSRAPAIGCVACGLPLPAVLEPPLHCPNCRRSYSFDRGVLDLRSAAPGAAPSPAEPEPLAAALQALQRGKPYKEVLEELLVALDAAAADRLQLLLREGRGSWSTLCATPGGSALFVGNAFSGTAVALTRAGFAVTLLESHPERLAFALHRNAALGEEELRVLACDRERLPFEEEAFDLVVQEGRPDSGSGSGSGSDPGSGSRWPHPLGECARVARGELAFTVDNRFAYKVSSGRRGEFRLRRPSEFFTALVRPRGTRTLAGSERALRRVGFQPRTSLALYPHARDFSQLANLGTGGPRLYVGPMERKNRLKVIGHKLGLFSWFTPSFAVIGSRGSASSGRPGLERILDALAERTGEARGELEHLFATRGNTGLVQTRGPGPPQGPGWWTLHLPQSPQQRVQAERHLAVLEVLRTRFPDLPVPEPLFAGRLEGRWLTCERRLPGLSAPQLTDDPDRLARMLRDVSSQLVQLVVQPAEPLDPAALATLVDTKVELALRYARVPSTAAWLEEARRLAHERLAGLSVPRVFYHADLRGKHVQLDLDGAVAGYLDWGSSEDADLPYFDLLHLVVHERKQREGGSAGAAWRAVRDGEALLEVERAALDGYARALSLPEAYCRTLEAIYPVLVGAMAEKNWDYSRPRWLHANFEI